MEKPARKAAPTVGLIVMISAMVSLFVIMEGNPRSRHDALVILDCGVARRVYRQRPQQCLMHPATSRAFDVRAVPRTNCRAGLRLLRVIRAILP